MINPHKIKKDGHIALLLRHAEREAISPHTFGNDVSLTLRGKEESITLGMALRGIKINHIYTSPVLRCVQTSQYIVRGYDRAVEITPTPSLGDPGLHIQDSKAAGEIYLHNTVQSVYRQYAIGTILPGLTPLLQMKEQGNNFFRHHTKQDGITLFISHDALIANYAIACQWCDYSEKWIDYLDGLVLDFSDYYKI